VRLGETGVERVPLRGIRGAVRVGMMPGGPRRSANPSWNPSPKPPSPYCWRRFAKVPVAIITAPGPFSYLPLFTKCVEGEFSEVHTPHSPSPTPMAASALARRDYPIIAVGGSVPSVASLAHRTGAMRVIHRNS
jgi:hypothetical protein